MSFVSVLFALLFYVATIVLVVGLVHKIVQYARVPSPLKIPTTPAPLGKGGVVVRLAREVILFESLFRSNKWIWIFGWMFHAGLALVVVRHLRYFNTFEWTPLAWLQEFGIYGGMAMVLGLAVLLLRRGVVDRVRYVTGHSDILMLLLLLAIGLSGFTMTYLSHTDIVQVKAFFVGLLTFNWQALPLDANLLIHLLLVAVLMIVFPFSKLLHAPGVFFSPTRHQVDNPREKRHVAPWARPLDAQRES